jgi:hypothetical protein
LSFSDEMEQYLPVDNNYFHQIPKMVHTKSENGWNGSYQEVQNVPDDT